MPTRLLLDGPDIESVLTRVQAEHGPDARIVRAEKVRTGGLAGFFAKERFEVSVEVEDAPPVDAPVNGHAVGPAANGAGASPASYDDTPPALRVAEEMDGPVEAPRLSTGGSAFADVLGSLTASLGTAAPTAASSDTFVPAPRPEVLPATRPRPAASSAAGSAVVVRRPAVPAHAGSRSAVKPPRPPRAAGAILALVGEGRLAYDAARDIARSMRIDPASVLLAAPEPLVKLPAARRVSNAAAARGRAAKLMTAPVPSIVVVDLPIGADPEWSVGILDGLGATAVWALVDATRKIADLNRWTLGLRHIDALVVHNASASDDPGSVKALGLPVALLDGRTATEAAWHALDPHRDW